MGYQMELKEQIGKRIKQLRKQACYTQEAFAEKAELSLNYIAMIEIGKKTPTIGTLYKIAQALDCDLAEFFSVKTLRQKSNNKNISLSPGERELIIKAASLLKHKIIP
jgi:transcriptional regulator with XRE-family HTH domain